MPEQQPEHACDCAARPDWARVHDDRPLLLPVLETAEWEELRQCAECGTPWLLAWPEEIESPPIICRPKPPAARRLRDIDRATTLRGYCLARLEEHFGELKEQKAPCKKADCGRKRLENTTYCIEHVIAQRLGRHLAHLERKTTKKRLIV